MSKIVKLLPIKISKFRKKKVLDSRETSPKWVSNPKSVKKIHISQKKKGEKTRIPCVSLERFFRFTEEIFKKYNTPTKLITAAEQSLIFRDCLPTLSDSSVLKIMDIYGQLLKRNV